MVPGQLLPRACLCAHSPLRSLPTFHATRTCRGFPTEYWWCWASIGFILATLAVIIGLFVAAMTFLGGECRGCDAPWEAMSAGVGPLWHPAHAPDERVIPLWHPALVPCKPPQ